MAGILQSLTRFASRERISEAQQNAIALRKPRFVFPRDYGSLNFEQVYEVLRAQLVKCNLKSLSDPITVKSTAKQERKKSARRAHRPAGVVAK